MSTEAPERSGGGGLDEFFGKKYGPLPGWAWAGVAAGGGYLYYRHRQNTSAASTSAASTASGYASGQGFDYGPSVATLQSEVQGLQSGETQERTTKPPTTTTTSSTTTTGGSTTTPSTQPSASNGSGGSVVAQHYAGPTSSLSAALSYLQAQGYTVTNISGGPTGNVPLSQAGQYGSTPVSVTPYSNRTARIGLQ